MITTVTFCHKLSMSFALRPAARKINHHTAHRVDDPIGSPARLPIFVYAPANAVGSMTTDQ